MSHGQWVCISRWEKDPEDGDGQPCEIDVIEMPAKFYRLRALASSNSVGEPVKPFCLSTGSGNAMLDLCISIANAASKGMISIDEVES